MGGIDKGMQPEGCLDSLDGCLLATKREISNMEASLMMAKQEITNMEVFLTGG